MGAEALLGAEVRYVDEAGAAVVTTLGELAAERVSKALPVRRIPSHAGQRHRPGLFWSATTGGHVPYESRLELDRCRIPIDRIAPTGTPLKASARMAQLEVAFQIVVGHPDCFSSEDVAGAKRVLAKTDKP